MDFITEAGVLSTHVGEKFRRQEKNYGKIAKITRVAGRLRYPFKIEFLYICILLAKLPQKLSFSYVKSA